MSYIANFGIPVEALPGEEMLTNEDDVQIEIERVVPSNNRVFPFLWIWGSSHEKISCCLRSEPELATVERLAEVENGTLVKASWDTSSKIINRIQRSQTAILNAVGTKQGWEFQVRAEDREGFQAFQHAFSQNGVPIQVRKVQQLPQLGKDSPLSLTEAQQEILVTAYREGYFEEPRQTSQEELGERFGISPRAVSDRLRRGVRNLIVDELLPLEAR